MQTPKFFSNMLKKIYHNYGENPGEMLVHTGAVGWILSSAAQIFAVIMNNNLSSEQKLFLIPQEACDGAVNIISFYTLTKSVKYIGSKLVKTGKIRTKEISDLLNRRGLILKKGQQRVPEKVYAGDWNFDITKLNNYDKSIKPTFGPFKDGAEVITGLAGSIISCNIITPIVRNAYASKKQKDLINNFNDWSKLNPDGLRTHMGQSMFDSFTSKAYSGVYSFSGNMKI